jgi:hypothetical protein
LPTPHGRGKGIIHRCELKEDKEYKGEKEDKEDKGRDLEPVLLISFSVSVSRQWSEPLSSAVF